MKKSQKLQLILIGGLLLQVVLVILLVPMGVFGYLASQDEFALGPGALDWTASVSDEVKIWRPNPSGLRIVGAIEIGPQVVELNYNDRHLIAKQLIAAENSFAYWIADLKNHDTLGPYDEESFQRACQTHDISMQLRDVYEFRPH